jgi:hypothetical protein
MTVIARLTCQFCVKQIMCVLLPVSLAPQVAVFAMELPFVKLAFLNLAAWIYGAT